MENKLAKKSNQEIISNEKSSKTIFLVGTLLYIGLIIYCVIAIWLKKSNLAAIGVGALLPVYLFIMSNWRQYKVEKERRKI